MFSLKTADEWMRSPTWHGSYDSYVRHVRGVETWLAREAEDRLADKIAARVVDKMRCSNEAR